MEYNQFENLPQEMATDMSNDPTSTERRLADARRRNPELLALAEYIVDHSSEIRARSDKRLEDALLQIAKGEEVAPVLQKREPGLKGYLKSLVCT